MPGFWLKAVPKKMWVVWQKQLSVDLPDCRLKVIAKILNEFAFVKEYRINIQSILTQNKVGIAFSEDCITFCAFFSPCCV